MRDSPDFSDSVLMAVEFGPERLDPSIALQHFGLALLVFSKKKLKRLKTSCGH
jgi:hypothetical protein